MLKWKYTEKQNTPFGNSYILEVGKRLALAGLDTLYQGLVYTHAWLLNIFRNSLL